MVCSGESAVLPREVGKEGQLLLRLAAEELDEGGELPLGRAFVQFLAVHEPAAKVRRGAHMALAVFVGNTRLIDNARL